MLQSVVGPPVSVGLTEMKSPSAEMKKDFKNSVPEETGFDRALQNKMQNESRSKSESRQDRNPERRYDSEGSRSKGAEQVDRSSSGKQKVKVSGRENTREKAIQEFMDSFESEFKIPSTRLVEAMAQLDDAELMLSPEATAESVISQLELGEEDTKRAQAMYAGLLQDLQATAVPSKEMMTPPEIALKPEGSLLRSLSHQEKGMQRLKSADEVSSKFWAGGEEPAQMTLPPALAKMLKLDGGSERAKIDLQSLPPHLRGQMSESVSPELLQQIMDKMAKSEAAALPAPDTGGLLQALQAALPEVPQLQPQLAGMELSQQAVPDQALEGVDVLAWGAQEGNFNSEQGAEGQSGQQGHSEQGLAFLERDMGDKLRNLEVALKSLEGFQVDRPVNTLGASGMMKDIPTVQVTQADPEAALQEVMNQARVLVREGGGEMKVQMNAEGLGNVQLKVHIQDGKVNLQMAADSHETKKMIETGLADLKSSLAAQKLSVENIKVDVVEEAQKQSQAQNNTNLNYNQQRDETRQFWNRFQDQFGTLGRRDALFDLSGTRGYGRERRDALEPIETKVARKVEGKGREINVVA